MNFNSLVRPQSVIIVEDHPLFRQGLVTYLQRNMSHLEVLYAGDDVRQARDICSENEVAVVLLDLHLGDKRTPGELVALFTSHGVPVLIVSALSSFETIRVAFAMGALGFVTKDSPVEEIGQAIHEVIAGREWMPPQVKKALQLEDPGMVDLSPQEKRALLLYASGMKLDTVARHMKVSPSTVKQYLDRSKAKYLAAGLPIRTKTEMYRVLRDQGLLN